MKMTKIRQNQLCYKLQDSRSRLMETYPFFAILLMYLQFIAVDNIKNISTNGRSIFFNSDFISKLYPTELDFILCHQIMHIINGDIWRTQSLVDDDVHRACDIYNNDQLISLGWKVSGFTHLGKLQYQIPGYHGKISDLSVHEINSILPYKLSILDEKTKRMYLTDTDFYWDYKDKDYTDGVLILDVPNMTKYVDELENFWMNKTEKVSTIIGDMGTEEGKVPSGIRRDFVSNKKGVIDWRKILDEFLQEEITDYSFTPPDRRYTDLDFFLPDFNEKDFMTRDILFMADTSASISRDTLSRVYDEISGAIEQFNGKLNGKLGFFDCEVIEPVKFESVDDVRKIIPYGGGGTNFDIIFEYIRERAEEFLPAMIIIFTDGLATFPEEKVAMNIPVLWLISNEIITPPWGTVARF